MTDKTPPLPTRVQRRRIKGFRLPPGTVCVSRPSRFGNPFEPYKLTRILPVDLGIRTGDGMLIEVDISSVGECLAWFRIYAEHSIRLYERAGQDWLGPLRAASHLACWCPPSWECHADVLIALLKCYPYPRDGKPYKGAKP